MSITSPQWMFTLKFQSNESSLTKPGLSLCFRLRSDHLFGHKDIGIVSIPMNEIFGQSACSPDGSPEKVVDYQVFTPISGRPRGTLRFSYKFGKKYGQEQMFKNVNQPNSTYNQNVPVTAYPYGQTGTNNMTPPGMGMERQIPTRGWRTSNHQLDILLLQVQKPQKKSNLGGMGAGVGLGLAGGLLGAMLVGEMISDVGDNMDAYDQGYDDAMDDMDY
ncbi:hypothetical protein K7X08_009389 [Anisodus acutangulus]|uniref:Uncharacterized protein n=1 Tax=Anisodus acutangulus TaxID=402998 RepID=A0A9Q1N2U1_9SOLA|nr:hypothetical protein K7X08_009389 [Anisodus acutangulus]